MRRITIECDEGREWDAMSVATEYVSSEYADRIGVTKGVIYKTVTGYAFYAYRTEAGTVVVKQQEGKSDA